MSEVKHTSVAEERFYWALKRISSYTPPEKLRRNSQKAYGLDGDEAIEMAYENVIQEAKNALRGYRRNSIAIAKATWSTK